jgi:hypothetical protein
LVSAEVWLCLPPLTTNPKKPAKKEKKKEEEDEDPTVRICIAAVAFSIIPVTDAKI